MSRGVPSLSFLCLFTRPVSGQPGHTGLLQSGRQADEVYVEFLKAGKSRLYPARAALVVFGQALRLLRLQPRGALWTGRVAGRVGVDEGGRVPLVFKVAHGRVGEGKEVCGGGQRQGEKTVQKRVCYYYVVWEWSQGGTRVWDGAEGRERVWARWSERGLWLARGR